MKRIISFVIAILILLPLNTVFASAAPVSDGEPEKTAYQTLLEGMLDEQEYIYISEYMLSKDELRALVEVLLKNEPMLFYCASRYSYSYNGETVISVLPQYDISGEDLVTAREFVETEINYILSTIPDGLDDCEKILYLHDYICLNYEYDRDDTDGMSYTMYDMLSQDEGVCMAFSLLFDELLTRLGIETRAIICDEIDHMWNEVFIDGHWYEADVTWDDPVPDAFGRATHANFLKSHESMSNSHNAIYDVEYPCDDKSFDEVFWHDSDKPFGFAYGEMYMIKDNLVYKVDAHNGSAVEVFEAGEKWWPISQNSYVNCRIGFGSYHDWLYYNNEHSIMRYNPLTNVEETFYTPEVNDGERVIGLYTKDNEVHYLVSPTLYAADATEYVYLIEDGDIDTPTPEDPQPEIIYGDVNGDELIDSVDYLLVKRACFGTYLLSNEEKVFANVNNDEKIDSVDYLLIKRIAFGTYSVA